MVVVLICVRIKGKKIPVRFILYYTYIYNNELDHYSLYIRVMACGLPGVKPFMQHNLELFQMEP